ncbi:putative efflux pump mfs2 [Colletotrichum spaethianum]|uniref:Efflux pump mfs2 n=1 Tax=Colletotrichum spaethianum TaxID=700344 RepID=A0AA37UJG8_9PEZI|nr:putative efflux pump mfs2 [Colletotrichum spaethianum]GKT47971.1 putative efflux pump mfs2 [Colletotrichum spaethianum]
MATQHPSEAIITAPVPAEMEMTAVPGTLQASAPEALGSAKDSDPFLITFARPYDAENPLDWPAGRKWMVTDVLSATGFNRIMVSTIMAPALTNIAAELHMTSTESAMALSIYLLATAFGPLIIGPMSEIYGRQVVLHASSVWFLIWNVLCGFAATKGTLIAARFLAGFGASAIYSLGGGVLGDVWRPEQRGQSLGVYLLIPLLGAAVGPIIGGFIAARTTWRWMFWSTSIFQAAMIFVSFFSFPESYGALVLRRRAARLRRETGDSRYYTASQRLDAGRSTSAVVGRALTRPLRLLLFHPIIQVSAVLSGFNYGIMYVTLSTFSDLWKGQYGQSVEISGLHYIACSLGELIGSQVGGPMMDHLYKRRRQPTPESRVMLMFFGIVPAWIGVLVYGWTAEYRLHWLVVDIGVVVMMFGMQLSGMPLTAYVIDTYGEHTSSAMAATQFVKSLTAFLFPLFAPSMYRALGYGWANSVMALAGVIISFPLPVFIWTYGARLRARATSTY